MNDVRTFAAMGTTGHLEVSGPHARRLARSAVALIGALEQRWSRFLPTSDVSRLNRSGGTPVSVDPSTIGLLELAVAAWQRTDGRFSPFLQRAMLDIGYRRSLSSGPILAPSGRPVRPLYVPLTHSPLRFDRPAGTVTLDPPTTGWSCATDVAAVTVLADSCANAEVLAKQFVLLGAGAAAAVAEHVGVDALIVGYDRAVRRVGQWERVSS